MWTDEYPKDVALKNGRRVTIRVLENADFDRLLAFFKGLSDADRLYLQHDVTDPELVRRWTTRLDFDLFRSIGIIWFSMGTPFLRSWRNSKR